MFRNLRFVALLAQICLLASLGARAEVQEPQQDDVSTQDKILNELTRIRTLLEALTRAQRNPEVQEPQIVTLTELTGSHLGKPDAPVTIVEYSDIQCPYCRVFGLETFSSIKTRWIDAGLVRYFVRDLPLDTHRQAMNAARALRCADDQGRRWEMRLELFKNATRISPTYLKETASALKLRLNEFEPCFDGNVHDQEIKKDKTSAFAAGIFGTPTFVIGRSTGETLRGQVLVGAQPLSLFADKLAEFLKAN